MSTPSNDKIAFLLAQLSEAVVEVYGFYTAKIVFRGHEAGKSFSLPVNPVILASVHPVAPTAAVPDARLNESDLTLLQAAMELGESPTASEIAKAAGFPYDSYVKGKLCRLRHYGFLGGAKGATGYPMTDAAYDAISGKE